MNSDAELDRLAEALVLAFWEKCPLCQRSVPKGSLGLHYDIGCPVAEQRRLERWFFIKLGIWGLVVMSGIAWSVAHLFCVADAAPKSQVTVRQTRRAGG